MPLAENMDGTVEAPNPKPRVEVGAGVAAPVDAPNEKVSAATGAGVMDTPPEAPKPKPPAVGAVAPVPAEAPKLKLPAAVELADVDVFGAAGKEQGRKWMSQG